MKVSSKIDRPASLIFQGEKKDKDILDKGGGHSTDYSLLADRHVVHIFTFLNSTYPAFS